MESQEKSKYLISAMTLATAVMIGAFGAHALQKMVAPRFMETFAVGARYQIYMGLGLFGLALFESLKKIDIKLPFYFIFFGMLIFSGSIYIYVLSQVKFFAMIVPIGGSFMILGWCWFFAKVIKS